MYRKAVYLFILIIFAASCTAKPAPADIETKVPEPTRDMASPTVIEQSAIEVVKPNVEKICPPNAKVPITEIGLPDNLSLLAVSENEPLGGNLGTPLNSDILKYSGTSPVLESIENISSLDDESKTINILTSPDGLHLAIFRWNPTSNHETLWISTLDGKEQRIIADLSPKQRVYWIQDNEVLVVGAPNEADYEGRIPDEAMMPLVSINPFTFEIQNLEPLPKGSIHVYGSYHSIDGDHYSMYFKDEDQKRDYFLYDYANKTSTQIFRWIDNPDNATGVGIRPNGLYYVVRGSEMGIDFALDLNIEQIAEDKIYNNVMKHLAIEHIQGLEITSMMASLTKNDILILTSDPLDHKKSTPVYLFDYKANVLKDYCINLGAVSMVFAPDEEFVAFTVNDGVNSPGYYVLIVNLKSGYYSLIEDIKAIGFGMMQ